MKYVSIDLECTGTNPEIHQILSVGVIVEDTLNILPYDQVPKLHCYVTDREVSGSLFALNMNRGIIGDIVDYNELKTDEERKEKSELSGITFVELEKLWGKIYIFIRDNVFDGKDDKLYVNVAGKNFGTFDKLFLDHIPKEKKHRMKFRQGSFDPGILYINWKEDERVPSLDECKQRSGDNFEVTHDALDDAWDVIKLLRKYYE